MSFPVVRKMHEVVWASWEAWDSEFRRRGARAEAAGVWLPGPVPAAPDATRKASEPRGLLKGCYGVDVGPGPRVAHRGRATLCGLPLRDHEPSLRWLAKQQAEDGGWAGPSRVATAALVLHAYLRVGYTNRGGHAHAEVIANGLRFLKTQQDRISGFFFSPDADEGLCAYALAARSMVVAFEMTESPVFRKSAEAALRAIHSLRGKRDPWSASSDEPRLDVVTALPFAELGVYVRAMESRGKTPRIRPAKETLAAIRAWATGGGHADENPVLRAGRIQMRAPRRFVTWIDTLSWFRRGATANRVLPPRISSGMRRSSRPASRASTWIVTRGTASPSRSVTRMRRALDPGSSEPTEQHPGRAPRARSRRTRGAPVRPPVSARGRSPAAAVPVAREGPERTRVRPREVHRRGSGCGAKHE